MVRPLPGSRLTQARGQVPSRRGGVDGPEAAPLEEADRGFGGPGERGLDDPLAVVPEGEDPAAIFGGSDARQGLGPPQQEGAVETAGRSVGLGQPCGRGDDEYRPHHQEA